MFSVFFSFCCGSFLFFLAICHILVLKLLISVLFIAFWNQNLWLACYLPHLGTTISHLPCYWQHSGLKSQIWVFKIVNLHDNFNILVFTHFAMVCYGFQRCLDGFHRFFDRLQWSFRGFKDLLRFRLKVFERLGFHLGFHLWFPLWFPSGFIDSFFRGSLNDFFFWFHFGFRSAFTEHFFRVSFRVSCKVYVGFQLGFV